MINLTLETETAIKVALVGPSGSGKTSLARALHQKLGIPLIPVDSRNVFDTRSCIREYYNRALRLQPAILFLDNIELLYPQGIDPEYISQMIACLRELGTTFVD